MRTVYTEAADKAKQAWMEKHEVRMQWRTSDSEEEEHPKIFVREELAKLIPKEMCSMPVRSSASLSLRCPTLARQRAASRAHHCKRLTRASGSHAHASDNRERCSDDIEDGGAEEASGIRFVSFGSCPAVRAAVHLPPSPRAHGAHDRYSRADHLRGFLFSQPKGGSVDFRPLHVNGQPAHVSETAVRAATWIFGTAVAGVYFTQQKCHEEGHPLRTRWSERPPKLQVCSGRLAKLGFSRLNLTNWRGLGLAEPTRPRCVVCVCTVRTCCVLEGLTARQAGSGRPKRLCGHHGLATSGHGRKVRWRQRSRPLARLFESDT